MENYKNGNDDVLKFDDLAEISPEYIWSLAKDNIRNMGYDEIRENIAPDEIEEMIRQLEDDIVILDVQIPELNNMIEECNEEEMASIYSDMIRDIMDRIDENQMLIDKLKSILNEQEKSR